MVDFLRKYGVGTTVHFWLADYAEPKDLIAAASHAAGDSKIIKNEGAEANTTNGFVDEGSGEYSIALTATEMQAARISLRLVDQSGPKIWMDKVLIVETYGHASAQHPFDLGSPAASLQQVSDEVFGEPLAGHNSAGTVGEKLNAVALEATVGNVESKVDTALADLTGISSDVGDVDTVVDAISAAVTALNDVSTAEVATEITNALTAVLADSIPALGNRPSIAQALYALYQYMMNRGVVAATSTIYKADGITPLFTMTLNDADDPTAVHRAS